ncbi:MAG: hypothetical protein JO323_09405 [Acidobacteriia bacterium]|nr:hypothetical protein [Terriglobia bacterium]
MGLAAILNGPSAPLKRLFTSTEPVDDIEQKCQALGSINLSETQKITGKLLEISESYYKDVRLQATRSFNAALSIACVGMLIFFVAIGLFMTGKTDKIELGVVAGTIPEIISGVVFYLYFRTMRHFGHFHVCLERMNRYLTASSISENISCHTKRDETRAELVKTMANAAMLPIEGLTERRPISAGTRMSAGNKRSTKAKLSTA